MSDAAKAPAASSASSAPSPLGLTILKYTLGIAFFIIAFLFIANDEASAQNLFNLLNIVSIIFAIIILYFIFSIFIHTRSFIVANGAIGAIYDAKYKPEKISETGSVNPFEAKIKIIKDHVYSTQNAEHRLGIIELDNMLREVLLIQGYEGETIGEQLKGARETRPFASLDNAWEAHLVRNKIAHEGLAFELGERETQRVFKLYSTVFEEFKII